MKRVENDVQQFLFGPRCTEVDDDQICQIEAGCTYIEDLLVFVYQIIKKDPPREFELKESWCRFDLDVESIPLLTLKGGSFENNSDGSVGPTLVSKDDLLL